MSQPCVCEVCGQELQVGSWPWCPHGTPSLQVVDDSIPGGQWIENLTPQPKKFYSKSEIRDYAKAIGVEQKVRHVPASPDSDKSPFTQRWI